MPSGSRNPATAFSVSTTAAKAPSMRAMASAIDCSRSPDGWRAISAAITSVSEVDCRRTRLPRSSLRSSVVLVRLPLWPSAIVRPDACWTTGWAFRQAVEPVVE
jgi:hypothetical protein